MPTWLILTLIVLAVLVVTPLVLQQAGQDLSRLVAPDAADKAEIERKFGKDTPAAKAALSRRFGKNRHWYDAATGLLGLSGLVVLYWLVFKS